MRKYILLLFLLILYSCNYFEENHKIKDFCRDAVVLKSEILEEDFFISPDFIGDDKNSIVRYLFLTKDKNIFRMFFVVSPKKGIIRQSSNPDAFFMELVDKLNYAGGLNETVNKDMVLYYTGEKKIKQWNFNY